MAAIAAAAWGLLYGLPTLDDAWMIHRGNQLVAKINAFHDAKGTYPDHLETLGIKTDENGGPFYYDRRDGGFILWYGKSLGESMIYKSQTKKWDDEG